MHKRKSNPISIYQAQPSLMHARSISKSSHVEVEKQQQPRNIRLIKQSNHTSRPTGAKPSPTETRPIYGRPTITSQNKPEPTRKERRSQGFYTSQATRMYFLSTPCRRCSYQQS